MACPAGSCSHSMCCAVLSHDQVFATLWTVVHQAHLSMGFSRQEYRVGCHSLLWGLFPTQGPKDRTRVSYISCTGRWVLYHWHHLGRPVRMICLHKLFGILLFRKSLSFLHLCMCLNISLIVWTHGYLLILMFLLLEMFQLCHRELFLSALLYF